MRKRDFATVLALIFSVGLIACGIGDEERNGNSRPMPVAIEDVSIKVEILEDSTTPVIDRFHPGSQDNGLGFENCSVIYHDGAYHMLVVEMFMDGQSGGGYWVPARIGHWKSTDGDEWTRLGTIVQGTNVSDERRKSATWSASFLWNEDDNRWNIFWRGDDAAFRWQSVAAGTDGIAGPYEEVKMVVSHGGDRGNKSWASGWIHSFGNVFRANDGKLYAFFSDFIVENGNVNWPTGLLVSEGSVDGPWKYLDTQKPTFNYCENPFVSKYDGMYLCAYDDLQHLHSIGLGYSQDGVHWKRVIVDLDGHTDWVQGNDLMSFRTPTGLVRESNGTYTVFFTAYQKQFGYYSVGKLRLKIDFITTPQTEKDKEAHRVDISDPALWTSINGTWHNEFDGLSVFETTEPSYVRAYTHKTFLDFEMETSVRAVGTTHEKRQISHTDARAGIVFGKADLGKNDDYYCIYASANRTITLARGNQVIKEVNFTESLFTYRRLKVKVQNGTVSVYFAGNDTPLIEHDLQNHHKGYVGLFAGKEHLHFESVFLREL